MTVLPSSPAAGDLASPLRFADAASARAYLKAPGRALCAGAVRRHPRRGQGQVGAAGAPGDGADRRRRLRGLCHLGRRHRTARPRLHGRGRPADRLAGALAARPGAHRLRRPCERRALAVRQPRDAARARSPADGQKGWTLFTGLEPEFSLLKRGIGGQRGALRRQRHAGQALLRLQGPVAHAGVPGAAVERAARHRHRRLPDRPRGRQRSVRDELHLHRRADLVRPLRVLQDGGQRDRARAGAGLLLHAQAVRAPAGQRHAHAPVDRQQ